MRAETPVWRRYVRFMGSDPVADAEDEIEFHLATRVEDLTRQGLSRDDAMRKAQAEFGDAEEIRREVRSIGRRRLRRERWERWWGAFAQDARFAVRILLKNRGFALVAVLTLGLGIGANTAIFSVVHGVLLRPFPYVEADRIVGLWQHDRAAGVTREEVSAANLLDWRERARSFSGMAALEPYGFDYHGPDEPVYLPAWLVTEDFFEVMGAPALHGRTLVEADFRAAPASVYESGVPSLVLSHQVWMERFGGDTAVVNRVVSLEGIPATVVGVMPPDFQFPASGVVWAPVVYGRGTQPIRSANYLMAVGRLRPGVALEEARAELDAISRQLAREHPGTNAQVGVTAVPLPDQLLGGVRPALLLLLGAVGLVLLIACANVANLLLARSAYRQREIAVRTAIGAGQGRLVRQLVTESLVLALAGGVLGVAVAFASLRVILRLAPAGFPRVDQVTIDPVALLFALAASLLTLLLVGLGPALSLTRHDAVSLLGGGTRGATRGAASRRMGEGLVVAEIGLALVLLVGAGLLIRSFVPLLRTDPGFRPDEVLAVTVQAWSYFPDPEQRALFVEEAIERIEALPGVEAAGMTSSIPLGQSIAAEEAEFTIVGRPVQPGEEPTAHAAVITDGYLDALRIPLVRGRRFTSEDRAGSPLVVLVNEVLAERYWADADPVGSRMTVSFAGPPVDAEVIGVVGDVRHSSLEVEPEPSIYFHHPQARTGAIAFTLRTAGRPLALLNAVQQVIWDFNRTLPIASATTLESLVEGSLRERRFSLLLLGSFSLLALLLATVGVYGLLSFTTRQRSAEIGVRMAMGAGAPDIMRWAIRGGVKLTLAGIAVGAIAAFFLTRLLRSLLFSVQPTDPLAFAGAAAALAAAALLASYLPARRAARVDPVVALRAE